MSCRQFTKEATGNDLPIDSVRIQLLGTVGITPWLQRQYDACPPCFIFWRGQPDVQLLR
jgi:hypothetical protein